MGGPVNELKKLSRLGQSIWLDYIDRHLLRSGELNRLIEEADLKGLTSNPAIFEKAIGTDVAYAKDLKNHSESHANAEKIFEQLAIADIQATADVLRKVYEQTRYRDGYVSLEVSPRLAYDVEGTISEAYRLWRAVNRENLMIKVPATEQGLSAITALLTEGINVNVTLLFSRSMYGRVADAWLSGLEQFVINGGNPAKLASVASFFVSRIDSTIDAMIHSHIKQTNDPRLQATLRSVLGKAAIANARLAYRQYQYLMSCERWRRLSERGAQSQRLLWASTGTKDPSYSDVLYVESLIGPDTVNTVPPATLYAFNDHGTARATLEGDMEDAIRVEDTLAALNISLDVVTQNLLTEGVKLFSGAYSTLLNEIMNQMGSKQYPVH
ncbi:MAG: transaldolase [Betaproteobacteria bacterium]|nr:transaldolase [Betaproteobacteria bacterium]